jgi:hypothetical protein
MDQFETIGVILGIAIFGIIVLATVWVGRHEEP